MTTRLNRNWVFVDLDCTLIDTKEMVISGGPEPEPGTPEHDNWMATVTKPEVLQSANPVKSVLMLMYNLRSPVVFITNRRRNLEAITVSWLRRHNLNSVLVMRPDNELSRAGDFKAKYINKLVSEGDTVIVIDDDPDGSIERVCKTHGWTHLKVTTY